MRILIIATLIVLTAIPALAAGEPQTDDQKTFYAIGLVMAKQLAVFELTPKELDFVKQGLVDGSTGRTPLVDIDGFKAKIQKLAVARRDAQGEKLAAKAHEYIEQAVKEKGAVKTASGMVYIPLKEGGGIAPAATDKVRVNYRGTFVDGKEFDSSYTAGKPVEFKLNQVVKCWTEGVGMMKVGGKAKLICPPGLAYGERGSGAIPANSTLVFEVELLDVVK